MDRERCQAQSDVVKLSEAGASESVVYLRVRTRFLALRSAVSADQIEANGTAYVMA